MGYSQSVEKKKRKLFQSGAENIFLMVIWILLAALFLRAFLQSEVPKPSMMAMELSRSSPNTLDELEELEDDRRREEEYQSDLDELYRQNVADKELIDLEDAIKQQRTFDSQQHSYQSHQIQRIMDLIIHGRASKLGAMVKLGSVDASICMYALLRRFYNCKVPVNLAISAYFMPSLQNQIPTIPQLYVLSMLNIVSVLEAVFESNPNLQKEFEEYILWYASSLGLYRAVQILIDECGVDPSANGDQALVDACTKGFYKVIEVLLSDWRVNPSAKANYCLKIACMRGNQRLVKLLLDSRRFKPDRHASQAFVETIKAGNMAIFLRLLRDGRIKLPISRRLGSDDALIAAIVLGRRGMVGYILAQKYFDFSQHALKYIGGTRIKGGHIYLIFPMLLNQTCFKFIVENLSLFPIIFGEFPELANGQLSISTALNSYEKTYIDVNELLAPYYYHHFPVEEMNEQALLLNDGLLKVMIESKKITDTVLTKIFNNGIAQCLYADIDQIYGPTITPELRFGVNLLTDPFIISVVIALHADQGTLLSKLILKYFPYIAAGTAGPMRFLTNLKFLNQELNHFI